LRWPDIVLEEPAERVESAESAESTEGEGAVLIWMRGMGIWGSQRYPITPFS